MRFLEKKFTAKTIRQNAPWRRYYTSLARFPVANALGGAIHDVFRTLGTRPSARSKHARCAHPASSVRMVPAPGSLLSMEKEAEKRPAVGDSPHLLSRNPQ